MRSEDLELEPYTQRTLPTLRDIVAVLFRQRWAALIAFAVVVAAVVLSGLWVPKYEAQMKILVRRQRSDAIVTSSTNAPPQFGSSEVSEEDLNSEVELLNSEDLLRKVVLKTGLSGKSESSAGHDNEVRIARAVRQLSKDLKIEPLRKSDVISVQYENRDPHLATAVLKTIAAAYMEEHMQLHGSSGELEFFDQETDRYQQGLDLAQKKLTDFSKRTGVVSAELERDNALQQAKDFDSTAHQAQTAVMETEHRVHELNTQLQSIQPRLTTVMRASDNPQLLQQLKSTLLNLELKRTELLTKFEPTYRLVKEVDQQIADAKSAISAEKSKPIHEEASDVNPNYEWVRGELAKSQADLSGLKARAAAAASAAQQYREAAQRFDQDGLVQQDLLRAAKMQEENYLLYVRKREEARISDALDQSGILNVALAEQPIVPALPNRSPLSVAFLTLLLAGTVSFSTALAADYIDPSFRTPDELARYLGTPVLAALPKGRD